MPEQAPTPEVGNGVPAQVAQPVPEQRPTPEVGNGVPALVASKKEVAWHPPAANGSRRGRTASRAGRFCRKVGHPLRLMPSSAKIKCCQNWNVTKREWSTKLKSCQKKSCIQETLNLSLFADSSTDAKWWKTVENSERKKTFENGKKYNWNMFWKKWKTVINGEMFWQPVKSYGKGWKRMKKVKKTKKQWKQ